MAWNKPSGAPKPVQKKPSAMRGVVAGLVVVAAAVACYFIFSKDVVAPQQEEKKNALIKEVTPAAAPKAKGPTNAERLQSRYPTLKIPDDWDKPYPPQAYWPDGRLKEHSRYVKVFTNDVSKLSMSIEESTFKNYADQQVAALLNMAPGGALVTANQVKFGPSFVQAFKASLNNKIEITDADTPAQAELKRAVIEAKEELSARMNAGEDVAKIMTDAWNEMRELSLYTREIEDMVHKARKENPEMTDADKDDLVRAANQMLKDRGIDKQLALPSAVRARAQMLDERAERLAEERAARGR